APFCAAPRRAVLPGLLARRLTRVLIASPRPSPVEAKGRGRSSGADWCPRLRGDLLRGGHAEVPRLPDEESLRTELVVGQHGYRWRDWRSHRCRRRLLEHVAGQVVERVLD